MTKPAVEPEATIVAIVVKLLDQVPPGVASLKLIVELTQTESGRFIIEDNGFTVIVVVIEQVVGSV